MNLDMKTVLIGYLISNAICASVIALLWWQNRRQFKGLEFWLADFVMQFAGLLLVAMRGVIPDFISMVVGNGLVIGGTILLYMGLEQFAGKRGTQWHNAILFIVFISIHAYFAIISPHLTARNVNLALALFAVCIQCAWLLLRRVDINLRPITREAGLVFTAYCLVNGVRVFVDLAIPSDNNLFHSNLYDTTAVMIYQMLFIALTFSLFLMVNRRLLMELQEEITERKRAGEVLKQSEELYRGIFIEHSAVKLLIDPVTGSIFQVNPAAANFYGYAVETLEAMNIDQISTLPREAVYAAMADALQRKRNYFIFQHRLASGEVRDVEVHSAPIKVGGRELLYSIVHDITARRQTEEKLRENEKLLQQIAANYPHSYISLIEKDLTVGFTSGQEFKRQNLDPAHFVGLTLEQVFGELAPIVRENYLQTFQGKETQFELFINNQHQLYRTTPLVNADGGIDRILAVVENVTERKQMEVALRTSEERYKSLYNKTPVMMHSIDPQGKLLSVSDYWLKSLGYTRDEVLGRPSTDFLTEDSRRYARETVLPQFLKTGQCNDVPYQFVRKNGEIINVLLSANSENDADGHVIRSLAVIIDITERKRVEETLERSRKLLAATLDILPVGVCLNDETGHYRLMNDAYCAVYEYKRDEMIGKHYSVIMPPDQVALANAHYARLLTGDVGIPAERKRQRKDGSIVYIEAANALVEDVDGQKMVITTVRDITERKHAEEELRESRETLSLFIKHSPIYAYIKEVTPTQSRVIQASENFIDLTGTRGSEMAGKTMEELFPAKFAAKILADDWEAVTSDRVVNLSEEVNSRYFTTIKFPLPQKDKTKLLAGYSIDITERRRAEEIIQMRLRLHEFANNHSLEELMQKALDEIGLLTESPIGFYHFVEPDQKTLSLQAWSTRTLHEFCSAEGKGMHYNLEQAGVWVDCVYERKAVIHNDYASLPHRKGLPAGHAEIKRELVAPILRNGLVVSILGVGNKPTEYDSKDVELVTDVADIVWTIVERKRADEALLKANESLQTQFNEINTLKEILQEQAIRDPLTELYNRRYLADTLEREIIRAKRENHPISFIMMDIDHFKKTNDAYGHQVGDKFLIEIAKLLKTSARGSDIVCRYGGEEFLLVLPGTTSEAAAKRAEDFRQLCTEIAIAHEDKSLNVTLSFGVSTYPLHGQDFSEIIAKADKALYASKENGRNRVTIWGGSTG